MTTAKRLGPDDWIKAGFRALAKGGASAIRVEHLGRELGASKGSFYWHFLDVNALKDAMLTAWVQLATVEISHAVDQMELNPLDALLALVAAISTIPKAEFGGAGIEPAIRDWARFDSAVAKTVARVDNDRIDYVTNLFASAGSTTAKAKESAELFYATFIGLEHLRLTKGTNMETAMNTLVHILQSQ